MSSPIDLKAWQQALADRQVAQAAMGRFEQHRFMIPEQERHAAAESMRYQAEEVAARLRPLRAAAEYRRNQLEQRLIALGEQQELLQARAVQGRGSASRINDANRTIQARISDCAVQINVLAKLLRASHPDDIAALDDEEVAFLLSPVDTPLWSGPAETALPRIVAGAGLVALVAAWLPWFTALTPLATTSLWSGIAGDATTVPTHVLGYVGIVLPVVLAAIALTALRFRTWLVIGAALTVTFVWFGVCYARITAVVPWWSISELFDAMRIGAWLYGGAAFVGLITACYYAQGEGNTLQRSLRAAGWLVVLFVAPGFLAASILALRPGPPPVSVRVAPLTDRPNVLQLTVANNTAESMEVSLPWSNETAYGIRVEIKLPGADMFRRVEETAECWRVPANTERALNRLSITPKVDETVWFDISCIRALGYAPERLRFTLTNADGHTVKAYQAIIPQ